MKTYIAQKKDQKRRYFLIDANGKILGRLATRVARLLMGKDKITYTPHIDQGDFVIVVNAANIRFSGRKPRQKIYTHFSGYPGGLKEINLDRMMRENPTEVIRHAVRGMLPKSKLGSWMITRLKVYAGPEHPHSAQSPELINI